MSFWVCVRGYSASRFAAALEHGADIATHDEHFRLVPMLTVIVPDVAL